MEKVILTTGTACEPITHYPALVVGPFGEPGECDMSLLTGSLHPQSPGTSFLDALLEEPAPPPPYLTVQFSALDESWSTDQYIEALTRHNLAATKILMVIEFSHRTWSGDKQVAALNWLETHRSTAPRVEVEANTRSLIADALSLKSPPIAHLNSPAAEGLLDAFLDTFATIIFFRPFPTDSS